MASTNDAAPEPNPLEDQEENLTTELSDDLHQVTSDATDQTIPVCESDDIDSTATDITYESMTTTDDVPEADSPTTHSTNMVTAEASFTEATSADLQPGATRSSVARILVKPGQIFRVQVDNEVKEVHGPATVRMISENRPDFPLPLHLPPGHVVQQVLDENGVLTHVIMSQAGPPPPHHVHTGYSSSPYNGLYAHPYPNPLGYGPYLPDTLSYQTRTTSSHTFSSANPSQCLFHPSDSNGFSSSTAGNASMTANATNPSDHHRRRSPVYNASNNSCPTMGPGRSHGRGLNNGGSKRRLTASHGHTNSYVNNTGMNGSHKSSQHQHHYPSFYSEMVIQPTNDAPNASATTDFDNDQQIFEQNLLKLSLPTIEEIESRTALVRIQPPSLTTAPEVDYSIDLSYLIYELLLSDKGKDAKYQQVYRGEANEITLKDLKPGTEYHLKVCACIETCNGEYTEPVPFTTEQCEPDRPSPPKLLGSRLKNSLTLKWTAAADNGSKILNYVLEYDEGKGREFVEVYRGVKKQFLLNKLIPATFYTFRLAAENSVGRSEFSEPIQFSTLGTIPPEPDPPLLVEQGVTYLSLSWTKRPNDETFSLQMNDESNYYRNKYVGSLLAHTVTDLYRNTEYQFRLAAHNQSGQSNYSQVVTYRTVPDRPDPPAKPRIKGQVKPTQCQIAWDPPRDNGGAEIKQYQLELEESKATEGFHVIYSGLDTEHLLEQLIPGHLYSLRLSCSSMGGQSDASQITQIKTPAVAPASCHPPKISGKPKANSLHLRWAYPDYDGGSPVNEFEVQVVNPDNSSRVVYRGHDLDCVVAGLSPGQSYLFQIRAFNRAGASPWSEYLDILSSPGVPEAPRNLLAECRTANSAFVTWEESSGNGAPITEYRLEWSRRENESFMQLYCGANTSYEAKGLTPVTHYFFRVQAMNSAGASPYSMFASCVTPAAPPSTVTSVKVHPKSTSLTISWKEPANNGSPLTGYYIDIGEKELTFASPDLTEFTIDEVLPDTAYRIRLRAANSIGHGPYSSTVKCQTKSLPPDVPQLECSLTTCNSMKLKWNTVNHPHASVNQTSEQSATRVITYIIEMEGKDGIFNSIYTGNSSSHKINKLQENTAYRFRICARNDAGVGPWSEIHTFSTSKAPPSAPKAPHLIEITSKACIFHWQAHKPLGVDPISYILELQMYKKESDYTEIYRGELSSYHATNLESGVDYRARVCAIRMTNEGLLLNSPYSAATHFVLPRAGDSAATLPLAKTTDHRSTNADRRESHGSLISRSCSSVYRRLESMKLFESRTLTDQQWAFVISVGFALLAIFIAIFANVIYSKYNNHRSVDNTISSSSSPGFPHSQ